MGKRVVVLVLVFVMILGVFSFVASKDFTDIKNHWAKEYIRYLAEEGIVSGDPKGTFRPDDEISRAEFAAMINRVQDLTTKGVVKFKDVPVSTWFYDDVAKAVADGYTAGYPDNTFKPSRSISREEASVMIGRVLYLDELNKVSEKFKDANQISSWAVVYVNAAKEAGYIQGDNNIFRPKDRITRAEAATILYKVVSGEPLKVIDVY